MSGFDPEEAAANPVQPCDANPGRADSNRPALIGKPPKQRPPAGWSPDKWNHLNRSERRKMIQEERRESHRKYVIVSPSALAKEFATRRPVTENSSPAGIPPSS